MFISKPGTLLTRQPKILGASFKGPMGILPLRQSPRNWKNSRMNRGQSSPIAAEYRPGPGGAIFTRQPVPAAPQNFVTAWHNTGAGLLTNTVGFETVLLAGVVPNGYKMILNAHTQFLEDGGTPVPTANEEAFQWILRAGGRDLLDPFENILPTGSAQTVQLGRLIRDNGVPPIPFGASREYLPVLEPGTSFEYVVKCVSVVAGNNIRAAVTLYSTLVGSGNK